MDYSEFSGGITEINRKMGLLDAEFKRATAEAALFGTESEKLEVKQQTLTQKIELQKKKIEEVAKAYDKAVEKNGYMSKATDQADKALLNERTTLLNLQIALKETEEKMGSLSEQTKEAGKEFDQTSKATKEAAVKIDEAGKASRSFGDEIRDVADFLGVNASPAVEKFASHFDGVNDKVGEAVLTLGTMVTTLGSLTLKTAESAKEIINTSQKMGMTTDQYQEWDYVLQMVGSDAESATGDIAALAEKAREATDKTSDSAKMFRILGVNVRDSHGALKSQNELFSDVITGLQRVTNETERNAIASELLSTTGENIVPILNMTAQELNGLKKEAREVGYVMSGDTLAGFGDLNKIMYEFHGVTEGLSQHFAKALLPVLTQFFSVISSIPTPVLSMMITLAGIIATMVSLVKVVDSTTGAFKGFKNFLGGVDKKTLKTTAIIMGVVVALIALVAIIAVIIGKGAELERTMTSVGTSVGNINRGVQGQQGGPQYYAEGTDYAPGGRAIVGEHGPEEVILPKGAKVLTAEETRKNSGGDTYILNATISAKDIKEFNDVVKFMKETKQAVRAGRVM